MKLSRKAKIIYNRIRREYDIDDEAGLLLLQTAFEAWDEMRKAQQEIDGQPIYFDRFGSPQEHPGCKMVRASRAQMIQALRALQLDTGAEEL